MIDGLRREDIERLTVRVLRPPCDARPDVRLINLDGQLVVVKDYASGGTRFKSALGVYLVGREHLALSRLAGVVGVPRYFGMLDSHALVTEYIPSIPAPQAPRELLYSAFFEALTNIIDEIHQRGVVHCDLKKLDNILVGEDHKPYVIDFTAAFVSGSNPLAGLIFSQMCDDDFRGIYKLKRRHAPDLLEPQESEFLDYRSTAERGFRVLREGVRTKLQRLSGGK